MSELWSDLLMADHEQTERVIDALEKQWQEGQPAPESVALAIRYFSEFADACHNQKEEQFLFPRLAAAGVPQQGGPLGVMLAEHDSSKTLLENFCALGTRYLAGEKAVASTLLQAFRDYGSLLKTHYWKENDILYPMWHRVLRPEVAAEVARDIGQFEASLGTEPRETYRAMADQLIGGMLDDLSANLDRTVLAALLNTLPVELSFVDADDCVRYFSHENHPKIFPRTRGVIGLKVQNCHPQKSVHRVNQILADFKAGARDEASFWIEMNGRKIHIRYFPVRSPQGDYLGCLETVQDITGIQQLEGQKRLLD